MTSTARYGAIFDHVCALVSDDVLPTAVLGLASSDGILAIEAFGRTGNRRARVEDHYRIFSITKPLVGLIAARELERGTLTLDTPLTDALPDFGRDREDTVRLRHLASHTAGITEPELDDTRPLREALLAAGWDTPVGTLRRYSSLAFEGIAAMIEHASGRTWVAGLDALNGALGSSFTLDEGAQPPPLVGVEGFDLPAFVAQRHPGAGALARAEDLLALAVSLLRGDGRVVRPDTLARMRRPLTVGVPVHDPQPSDAGDEFGFTWKLRGSTRLTDRDVFGHAGWSGTEFWLHPSRGIAWTLLTNRPERPGFDVDALDTLVVKTHTS